MKKILALSSFVVLAGCVTPDMSWPRGGAPVEGGVMDRRAPQVNDCDRVIPIIARDTEQGNAREDAWIARNYPGSETIGRRRTECNGKTAEVITVRDRNGVTFNVTFDISSFFGKTSSGDDLDDLLDG